MTERSKNKVVDAAINKLHEETGLPFWKEAGKADAQKPYAVMITIPGVRSMYAADEYKDFLTGCGLDKGGSSVLREKDSVKKEFHAPGDSPPTDYTLVLQGKNEQEFEAVVGKFCQHFPEHLELKKAWLRANPSRLIDALKETKTEGAFVAQHRLPDEQREVLQSIVYPPNTHVLEDYIEHLSKMAVAQDAPKQAAQASKVLDIISEHVPALRDNIYAAREQSRLPALPGGESGKKYLAERMEIQKDGMVTVNPFPGFYARHTGDMLVAQMSKYKVKFTCNSQKDANEFALHVTDALKEVAKIRPQFSPMDSDDRPCLKAYHGYPNIHVQVEDDGKTINITPPMMLDDVWKMYEKLAPNIKPSLQVAQAMDWARHAEYRGAVEGYSMEAGGRVAGSSVSHLLDPAMQRGAGYGQRDEGGKFSAMLGDIAGMLAATGDVETAGSQLVQLSHLALQGEVKDKDGKYPDMHTLLPGRAKSRAIATNEYAGLVHEYTDRLARDMVSALQANGVEIDTAKGLGEQLSQAAEKMSGPLKARDQAVIDVRNKAEDARSLALWLPGNQRSFRDMARHITDRADEPVGTALMSLTGGLGKAQEPEQLIVDRPYPFEYDDHYGIPHTATPVYWSRSGEKSLQPPRLELPQELQAALDAYRAQGEWARSALQAKLPAPSISAKK